MCLKVHLLHNGTFKTVNFYGCDFCFAPVPRPPFNVNLFLRVNYATLIFVQLGSPRIPWSWSSELPFSQLSHGLAFKLLLHCHFRPVLSQGEKRLFTVLLCEISRSAKDLLDWPISGPT